ncbi:MAG TPA: ABC-2 family transporter protein [Stellaceae bacterium]|nr:ABC-2 family transporter protein [Stellaceae bacterium]
MTNLLDLLGNVLLYWVILAIFWGLWSATPLHELGTEFTQERLFAYLAVTEWIAFAVGLPYREVEAEIQGGTIDMRLARPIPFGLATLAIWVGEAACRSVVLASAGVGALLYALGTIPLPMPSGALLLASVALSVILVLLWHLQIGLVAAWLGMSAPTFWIWQKLLFVFGGLIMPLTIYPAGFGAVAKASPFAAMLFAPGSLMLQDGAEHAAWTIGLQLAWLALSILCAVAVERAAVRRFVEHGTSR